MVLKVPERILKLLYEPPTYFWLQIYCPLTVRPHTEDITWNKGKEEKENRGHSKHELWTQLSQKEKTCVKACEVIAINRDLKSKYEAYIIWIILHILFSTYYSNKTNIKVTVTIFHSYLAYLLLIPHGTSSKDSHFCHCLLLKTLHGISFWTQ